MGNVIAIAGNTGIGKTTLAMRLGERTGYQIFFEELTSRPFQRLFRFDTRFALANQIDFLVMRAEQERIIRSQSSAGILDGGLDIDYYVFSRLFHEKGWLTEPEFELLTRLYRSFRQFLPQPEVIISMSADIDTVIRRYRARSRELEIAQQEDARLIDKYLRDWLATLPKDIIITLDASGDDPTYNRILPGLVEELTKRLGRTGE